MMAALSCGGVSHQWHGGCGRRRRSCRLPVRCAAARPPRLRAAVAAWWDGVKALEEATRPGVAPEMAQRMQKKWEELPDHVKTPSQMLGKITMGCEGTHGVFPRCNFACQPCYHGAEANRVRTDGAHTLAEVQRQMDFFEHAHGPHGHCQLIGGEVSLLEPEDHARVLESMRERGRVPMSFTHGDFDYDYLLRLATHPDGSPRTDCLRFAIHFDKYMRGRRGFPHSTTLRESDLMPARAAFMAACARLQRETGVSTYVAHNMTVLPGNLNEISGVIRDCVSSNLNIRLFSFQPAAYQGDSRRWSSQHNNNNYSLLSAENGEGVWREIERGAGRRLPYHMMQMGDERCNRSCAGVYVGSIFVPFFDEGDEEVRDVVIKRLGSFVSGSLWILFVKAVRAAMANPRDAAVALRWVGSFVQRAGGVHAIFRHGVKPVTFVMHRFMDAEVVVRAWDALEKGVVLVGGDEDGGGDESVRLLKETQERLQACSYLMAHPGSGRCVPACVQHAVYDVHENRALAELLPLSGSSSSASLQQLVDFTP